jgi:uncharacterized protein (TIGR03437 family)
MKCIALLLLFCWAAVGQSFRPRLGVEIDGLGDAARSRPFVNHAKLHRPCTVVGGSTNVAVDERGWPQADALCVMFDVRAIPAWAPPIDDPQQFQPDWSGTWNLSFVGQAELSISGGTAEGLQYDRATNKTSGRIVVGANTGLLIITFRNTKRTAEAASGTGFADLNLTRPGYPADSRQIYTDEFLQSFRNFQTLRYMDFTATNDSTPSGSPTDRLNWNERRLPFDATQQNQGRKVGGSWELAVQLANQTGTDMWINIPAAATDAYIESLANMMKNNLHPRLKIYMEHGNEVWNPLFANQYNFNRNAAQAEVAAGGSNLSRDGITNLDRIAQRRHLRRVKESVEIFGRVFGADQINQRIRGIYAWWTIFPEQYRNALLWAKDAFGDPKNWLYATAQTHYFNVSRAPATATPEQLIDVMRTDSTNGLTYDRQFRTIAAEFGIKHTVYEGGPDVGGGSTVNVGNRILANRLPQARDLIKFDLKDNWFDLNGDEYMVFSHCGPCSRFGCWGLSEDIVNLATPKWQAVSEISNPPATAQVTSIVNAASFEPKIAGGSFATLFGSNLADAEFHWNSAILDGIALPTMLGGVSIKVAGKAAAIQFVKADQVNFLVPSGLPSGQNPAEVTTRNGTWRGNIDVQPAGPGFFGYQRDGRFYPVAFIANTGIYVAPTGSLPGVSSRPVQIGEIVEFYVTGLGPTARPVNANEAIREPIPVADLNKLNVTIGAQRTEVLYAGLTFAGVYQVNVRIPAVLSQGDQRASLSFDGIPAQQAWITVGDK